MVERRMSSTARSVHGRREGRVHHATSFALNTGRFELGVNAWHLTCGLVHGLDDGIGCWGASRDLFWTDACLTEQGLEGILEFGSTIVDTGDRTRAAREPCVLEDTGSVV